MAKSKKKRAKKTAKKSTKKKKKTKQAAVKKKTARKAKAGAAKRKSTKPKSTKRKTAKRKTAKRKKTAAKKKRAPRRTEADMSWPEVRESRRRNSEKREDRIVRDFERAVNMTPQALETWLGSEESRSAGSPRSASASESEGHWSGRRIVEIRQKKAEDYTSEDYSHMRKVAAYVKRHSAQRPEGDVKDTPWRHSLMNWGHDPLA